MLRKLLDFLDIFSKFFKIISRNKLHENFKKIQIHFLKNKPCLRHFTHTISNANILLNHVGNKLPYPPILRINLGSSYFQGKPGPAGMKGHAGAPGMIGLPGLRGDYTFLL